MSQVQSTSISEIGYNRRTMKVKFTSGKLYEFKKVPRAKFDEFMSSNSKGQFFNKQVRDLYSVKQLN